MEAVFFLLWLLSVAFGAICISASERWYGQLLGFAIVFLPIIVMLYFVNGIYRQEEADCRRRGGILLKYGYPCVKGVQ